MSFICHPEIHQYERIETLLREMKVGKGDCILTNRYTFNAACYPVEGAQIIWQEDYGVGEPDCGMVRSILSDVASASRIIGIGGGTVLDIAKIMALNTENVELYDLFSGNQAPIKKRELVLVPTTCGTGSEVTNVAVVAFPDKGVKLGLANRALFADHAVLVPEFLRTLPYRPFIYSAIDALVHAAESLISPKSNAFTRLYSVEAIRTLISGFKQIAQEGFANDINLLADFQLAACQAGLAFGNAGCGTVHAMSYPVGAEFHIAHGEVNYALFLDTLRYYQNLEVCPESMRQLQVLLADCLKCTPEKSVDELDAMLTQVIPRKRLCEYGMTMAQIDEFSALVMDRQQRLLRNSPHPMDHDDIQKIYRLAW